jgi:hypothetical protein
MLRRLGEVWELWWVGRPGRIFQRLHVTGRTGLGDWARLGDNLVCWAEAGGELETSGRPECRREWPDIFVSLLGISVSSNSHLRAWSINSPLCNACQVRYAHRIRVPEGDIADSQEAPRRGLHVDCGHNGAAPWLLCGRQGRLLLLWCREDTRESVRRERRMGVGYLQTVGRSVVE